MIAAGLLLFSLFSSLALGRPTAHDVFHVHERRSDVPNGFKYVGKAAPNATLDLRIALVQSDPAGLEAALYDVSTPGSKNYRKHLTKAQADAFIAPKPESVQAVTAWLAKNNVTAQTSATGEWMKIRIPVSQANALLDTQFNEYSHDETGLTVLRTMSYSVPASVKGHLDFIYPATAFVAPRPVPAELQIMQSRETSTHGISKRARGNRKSRTTLNAIPATTSTATSKPAQATGPVSPDDSCKTKITPACLQAIYNIPPDSALNTSSNIFVASFVGESADPADLKKFLGEFRPDVSQGTTFRVKAVDGGTNNASKATIEASLDVQYTVGVAAGVDTTFVSVGSNNTDGIAGFLDVINDLISQEEPPFVLTTSFGFNEKDVPVGLANNLCNAYAKLGARGTTIIFGSGDGGVAGIQNQNCTTFVPTFPSSCPFVTSVGGTNSFGPEVAVSFSAGGFSNVFARPKYQDDVVPAYLKTLGSTNKGLFNASGRGFPDIAAQAKSFQVVRGGQTISVSGTSAAGPTVAGVVALLNDAVFQDGGQPLGFLNPLLYSSAASALNDITQGNNPGCGTDGFPTSEGWDPVTGLGTPDFAKLLDVVKKSS
ncbi:subtilisin-like protein [Dichomitus squalens]|uniref:tripeptidyl-peptidase II n=1 Tax=Dichomitus squalens TaxID=114155 RepID=A0A4V2JYZ5_9APHY|nr:subtilisin-like protein [Dichomitus squalens]